MFHEADPFSSIGMRYPSARLRLDCRCDPRKHLRGRVRDRSGSALAAAIGVTNSTLLHWENEQSTPLLGHHPHPPFPEPRALAKRLVLSRRLMFELPVHRLCRWVERLRNIAAHAQREGRKNASGHAPAAAPRPNPRHRARTIVSASHVIGTPRPPADARRRSSISPGGSNRSRSPARPVASFEN